MNRKKELTTLIRDRMATEKWRIWEHMGLQKREDLVNTDLDTFQKNS